VAGRPQRHFTTTNVSAACTAARPDNQINLRVKLPSPVTWQSPEFHYTALRNPWFKPAYAFEPLYVDFLTIRGLWELSGDCIWKKLAEVTGIPPTAETV
jgi:hypothetical protein